MLAAYRVTVMEPGGRLEKSSCKLLNNARSVAVRGVVSALLESKFEEIVIGSRFLQILVLNQKDKEVYKIQRSSNRQHYAT